MSASTLHKKLAEVLTAVGYIEKAGTNQSQGYKYVMAAQVADKVRDEFAKRNLTMLPSNIEVVESGLTPSQKQVLSTLRVTWTITDADSGATISFQSVGSGSDSTDKAVYKAMTGALKYALLLGFLIPTGDDPENEGSDKVIADAAKRIFTEDKPAAKPAPSKAQAFDPSAIEF